MNDLAHIAPNHATLNEPLFVVGPLRSGTTLLRLLLDHHPEINLFGEFEFAVSQARGNEWPPLEDYYGFLTRDRAARQFGLHLDKNLHYMDLQRAFLSQLHQRNPRRFIGAAVHSRMDLLPQIWPNARYIHLLRDPRDVARSCIGMGWVGNVYCGSQYWLEAETHRAQLIAQVPQHRMYRLRYEDLVREPQQTLTALCEFIGVAYTEQMLKIDSDTSYRAPDSRLAEQWRKKLSASELRQVEYRCAEKMTSQGYIPSQPDLRPPSLLQRIYLNAHNRSVRAIFHIRRWGLPLWCANIVARHWGNRPLKNWVSLRINRINARYLQ